MEIHEFKSALILRILLVIPLVILVGRTCLFLLKSVKRTEKDEGNFDELVKRKAEYLKFNMANQEILDREINLTNTEKVYKEFFSLPKNRDNPEKERFFQVFGNLQWGESPLHFDVIKYLKKYHFINLDLIQATQAINYIIRKDILISPKWPNLPTLSEFEQVVAIKILFNIFMEEASYWGKENLRAFCKKEDLDLIETCRGIVYFFSPIEKTTLIPDILKNSPTETNLLKKFNPSDLQKKISDRIMDQIQQGNNPGNFLREISNLSVLFDSLKKITPLSSKFDLDGARRIFNLSQTSSPEEIKRRYKSLAKINHPDTLISFGLPEEVLKTVNENFRQVKSAYDLLMANQLSK